MKGYKRWLAGLLTCAALTTASVPCGFAAPEETPFAEFRIDAVRMDKPEQNISVNIYHRDSEGLFQLDSNSEYVCKLNRATKDASFFIQANASGVWVSVDYLTDINGDGVYEYLEDLEAPVWDIMDLQGVLSQPQPDDSIPMLTEGQPYILSPELLVYRSQQAVRDRLTDGPYALDVSPETARQDFPLCMVRLHRNSPDDGQDLTQTYYLRIYDDVLIPFDVSPDDWYYDAVAFGLAQGYFSGNSEGLFLPDSHLPRAQLAQVLWAMSGSREAEGSLFLDVSPDDWFYPAVSWCQEEGLISGYSADIFAPGDLLTREQMVTVLHQYARYSGTPLRSNADLPQFSDTDEISDWALDSVRWAVSNGLLSGSDGALRPRELASRAELASALYSYILNAGLRSQNFY